MRAWTSAGRPRAVLAIRLQAFGDVVITLPYLQALAQALPGVPIDLVTRAEDAALPREMAFLRHVRALGGGRAERWQMLHALAGRSKRYDVVLDLQDNRVSRLLRRLARPRAWSTFDRLSPRSAGERTRRAIEAAGFVLPEVRYGLQVRDRDAGLAALRGAGWRDEPLLVLNPAGAFVTRHWPIDNYIAFARAWLARQAGKVVLLGLPSLAPRTAPIAAALGPEAFDLVGRTTAVEAHGIVRRARLVLSEDSGLMHMAWVNGVPTVALFGSSRADWSAPQGPHSVCLHSGDLDCGACLSATCRHGDVRCLTRYTPERVLAAADTLLARHG